MTSSELSAKDCETHLETLRDIDALRRDWQLLQATSDCSVFLNWHWIGNIVSEASQEVSFVVARVLCGDELLGIALLGQTQEKRKRVVFSKKLVLNETGRKKYDSLTMEHNGVVAKTGCEALVTQCVFAEMNASEFAWDEFAISGLESSKAATYESCAAKAGLDWFFSYAKPYSYVNLNRFRDSDEEYLGTLSRNTRYQLRKARKVCQEQGELCVDEAKTIEQARAYFKDLIALHQEYWVEKGFAGAFGSEFTHDFHFRFLEDAFAEGLVQVLKISAGDAIVGYLYNLVYRGVVYNYQSGINYELNSKSKPGLISHLCAIEYNVERHDYEKYDFLMGDQRYKRSLGTDHKEMFWVAAQKPRVRFKVESLLRGLARKASEKTNS